MRILGFRWDEIMVQSRGLCRLIGLLGGRMNAPRGFAAWPFVVVRDLEDAARPWLLNHERIHLRQQRDLLVVGMYVHYFAEYFWARWVLRLPRMEAYVWTSAEQEAFLNQHDLDYLKRRPRFAQFAFGRSRKRFKGTDLPGEIVFY